MTQHVSQEELKKLNITELRVKFNEVVLQLAATSNTLSYDYQTLMTSLQNIERELCIKVVICPKP